MIDEIYDRHYQDARSELNAALVRGAARLRNAVLNTFQVLNRIEYDAPWTAKEARPVIPDDLKERGPYASALLA